MKKDIVIIPGLGECKFDEDFGCYCSESIEVPVLSGNECRIFVEGYGHDVKLDDYHTAIANFLAATPAVLTAVEPHIYRYYLNVKQNCEAEEDFPPIQTESEIWSYIQIGEFAFVSRRSHGDKAIYISIECECDWEPEHGLQIVFKNGLRVNKIGPYDGHLTNADAFADSSLEEVIYR